MDHNEEAARQFLEGVAKQQAIVEDGSSEPEEFKTEPVKVDRSAVRKGRKKNKLNEDTLAMQERYKKAGLYSIAEIAYLTANEQFENLHTIEDKYGIDHPAYTEAFERVNAATKTALPYFAISMKAEMIQVADTELDGKGVEDALAKMLKKR